MAVYLCRVPRHPNFELSARAKVLRTPYGLPKLETIVRGCGKNPVSYKNRSIDVP